MTDKLTLYNNALVQHLGERSLASLTEAREPRRVLDANFDGVVRFCLERKFWNFGYRTVEMDASTTVVPTFGFLYAFKMPDDWVRTRKISAVPSFAQPLLQVAEEAGYWYANLAPIYVQYNSIDPLYGLDMGRWPESFADYVALRLASRSCQKVKGNDDLLKGPNGLLEREKDAYKIASSICAMNEAIGFAPMSPWVRARRGFSPTLPGPGGDSPTGGSLIP